MKLKFLLMTIVAVAITLSPAGSARGEEQNTEPLNLNECISIALQKNPMIQSFNHQYRASKARVSQAYAFPQPTVSLDYDLQPKLFDLKGSDEQYIGISQDFEFPGKRILRGKIAKKEANEFLCDVESAKLELIYQVKEAFYQLLLEIENGKYAEENLEHAGDFLNKAKEKYDSGDVSKLEVLKARVEAARAENNRKVAINKIKLAKSKLNFVLARDKYQPIDIRGSLKKTFPKLELKQLVERALLLRPEVKKAKLALEREKLNRTQAYMGYLPDFSLGAAKHRVTGEPSTWDVTLEFQVPLFFWQPRKGEVAEANANILSQKQEKRFLELSVSMEVENAFHNAVAFQDQIEFFEKQVLEEAEEVHRMSMISYKEGKIGSIELIESRKTLIELKQSYAETLLNYQLALAELEKFVGQSFE
jgi:outer membrane protein TolC